MSVPKKMMIPLPSSHIQVILRNLIDNAIKHNKDKGEIIIKANMQKDKWQIQLSNTTKNNLDEARIVERKYKTGETAGHGIGMSIVSDMCKMHDLTLEFSEQGKMVTVMISGKKIS
jgi:K+-sensing histidine kinase KdpD